MTLIGPHWDFMRPENQPIAHTTPMRPENQPIAHTTPDLFAEYRKGEDKLLCDYPQGEIPPAPQPDEINYSQRLMEYARAVRFRGDW